MSSLIRSVRKTTQKPRKTVTKLTKNIWVFVQAQTTNLMSNLVHDEM